ncbi:MAG: UDP-N-acetylmuramoyl-L-alanyl-D-glutamate--2,6-diaminopimelate ligase [Clostridia bacterium]|nr:UDP-N-acetylmuramoyl-L-alanyl-D-glutamate--2,6-diaminopimelate ligase [Clostridia bacterium]
MLLSELLTGCRVHSEMTRDVEVANITTDSRNVKPGDVFIALRGEHCDGNDHIKEALALGAAAVISDAAAASERVIRVGCAERAAAVMFSNYYKAPADGMRIIAVTGTNGKTSTVSAISHILKADGAKVGVIGSAELSARGVRLDREEIYGAERASMTTPDTQSFYKTLRIMNDTGCDTVVMEASSHALSRSRLDALTVDVGVFTNLTPEHLDYHGDMENYFLAKRRLARSAKSFLSNFDDPYGRRMAEASKNSFGYSALAGHGVPLFAQAENITCGAGGVSYDLVWQEGTIKIKTKLRGRFALYNTLAASAACLLAGTEGDVISRSLENFCGAPGRMEVAASGDGIPTVIIDYAHTADALDAALRCVAEGHRGRIFLVFGCGGDRDRSKRAPMGNAACRLAYRSFITEDNSRSEDTLSIIKDIEAGFFKDNYKTVPDRKEAIRLAVDEASPDDVILCAGKGHEKYIIDKRGKHFFDERAVILDCIEKKYGKMPR